MHLHENTLFDLDLEVKVKQDVAQFTLHHVTYSDSKYEVATSNDLGGDAFTKKLHYFTLTLQNVAKYLYIM